MLSDTPLISQEKLHWVTSLKSESAQLIVAESVLISFIISTPVPWTFEVEKLISTTRELLSWWTTSKSILIIDGVLLKPYPTLGETTVKIEFACGIPI